MFVYEKKLQYPVNIKTPNPRYAQIIMSQYGGPDGELGASIRYLSQRFTMPCGALTGLLTDIGTEELGHLEMIGAIVYQLTRNLSIEDIKKYGYDAYFIDHTTGIYPQSAGGTPWSASGMQSKGDDNILRLVDDPDVIAPIKFLREREVVHYQRFGEGLRIATDNLNDKNFYAFNPEFDIKCKKKQ
ncbi:MAG: manganese catalase family protein [Oscillospiraceae bacterium]